MNYHTTTTGPNEAGFKLALGCAYKAAKSEVSNEMLLLTHNISMLDGAITSVLGGAFMKKFIKLRAAEFNGVTMFLETERIKSKFSTGVILVPFCSLKLVQKAKADYRSTDVVYLPWADTELVQYLKDNPGSVQI